MYSGLFFIVRERKTFLFHAGWNIKKQINHYVFFIGFFAQHSSNVIFEENDRYAGIR